MELEGQGTGLSGFTALPHTHTALPPRITKEKKQGSPISFPYFSKMVIKSYLNLRGKDDCRWRFDKMGGGFFSVIRYYKPLVVQLCQLPSFAFAGIQYHSTVISLYNMLKISFFGIYEGMEGDDEMDEEDGCKIVWQPYKRLGPLDQFLPPYCIGQQKMGMSRTVLICFERFAYHRPDISPKQFGLKESCLHRPLVELGRLKRWNGRIKDLGKDQMHNTYKQEWDARNDCLICPPDYSTTDGAQLSLSHSPPIHVDWTNFLQIRQPRIAENGQWLSTTIN